MSGVAIWLYASCNRPSAYRRYFSSVDYEPLKSETAGCAEGNTALIEAHVPNSRTVQGRYTSKEFCFGHFPPRRLPTIRVFEPVRMRTRSGDDHIPVYSVFLQGVGEHLLLGELRSGLRNRQIGRAAVYENVGIKTQAPAVVKGPNADIEERRIVVSSPK